MTYILRQKACGNGSQNAHPGPESTGDEGNLNPAICQPSTYPCCRFKACNCGFPVWSIGVPLRGVGKGRTGTRETY